MSLSLINSPRGDESHAHTYIYTCIYKRCSFADRERLIIKPRIISCKELLVLLRVYVPYSRVFIRELADGYGIISARVRHNTHAAEYVHRYASAFYVYGCGIA